jgi:nucleoside-diphosphate-sugar epimerase
MTTHAVLGGTGVIGRETIAALLADGRTVTSVSRSGAATPGAAAIAADVRDASATLRALEGADVAHLTVGLPYRTRDWQRDWPVILRNVINACLAHGTRLVYFDNVYAYGKVDGPMTESTPIRPSSRKGALRAELLAVLDAAGRDRGLGYTVGRSADFYGPGATTSVFTTFAIDKVAAGRAPAWMFDSTRPHSLTYTPDIGRGLAVLGTDERALGHSWHLPTAPALTGEEYLALLGGDRKPTTMSMGTVRFGALFSGDARESLEMAYQYTAPYVLDSSRFEGTFGLAATPYAEGVAASLAYAREGLTPGGSGSR